MSRLFSWRAMPFPKNEKGQYGECTLQKFNHCLSKISSEHKNNISQANLFKPRAKWWMVNFPKFNHCLSKISTELYNNISQANLFKPRAKFFAKRGLLQKWYKCVFFFQKSWTRKRVSKKDLALPRRWWSKPLQIYIFHFIYSAPEPILIKFGIKIFNWTCPLPLPLLG